MQPNTLSRKIFVSANNGRKIENWPAQQTSQCSCSTGLFFSIALCVEYTRKPIPTTVLHKFLKTTINLLPGYPPIFDLAIKVSDPSHKTQGVFHNHLSSLGCWLYRKDTQRIQSIKANNYDGIHCEIHQKTFIATTHPCNRFYFCLKTCLNFFLPNHF